mmetsp:Transcript_17481/g.26036  ORF Transcript_17481/g.26036 Transcript_17481/m.26036 type:complete len:175 (-) Transcript_17481:862-1386(-)
MSYVWYLICYTLSAFLEPCCKWNADACTFVFDLTTSSGKYKNKTVRLLYEDEYECLPGDVIQMKNTQRGKKKSDNSNKTSFAIKVMQMINAAGDNSCFVGILAIKNMPPDTFHVEEVAGLSLSTHVGARGLVYFSRTRCGTKAMWKNYFFRVVKNQQLKLPEIRMILAIQTVHQ